MDKLLDTLSGFLGDLGAASFLKIILMICVLFFLLGLIFKLLRGRQSLLNSAVGSASGMLMVYVFSFILVAVNPLFYQYIPALPLIRWSGSTVELLSLSALSREALCYELVRLMMFAFLMNLADALVPASQHFFPWLLSRCGSVALAFAGYWIFDWAMTMFLPGVLTQYAPVILVVLVILLLCVSIFRLIIGIMLGMAMGPVMGALYTFFFSSLVGKQIVKAVLTSLLLLAVTLVLHYFGFTALLLSSSALMLLSLSALVLLLVWFLLFRFF